MTTLIEMFPGFSSKVGDEEIDLLIALNFVMRDDNGELVLTEDGALVSEFSLEKRDDNNNVVSQYFLDYQASVIYAEAYRQGLLSSFLPLIAVVELEDLRESFVRPYKDLAPTYSDYIAAAHNCARISRHLDLGEMTDDLYVHYNISPKSYAQYVELLADLEDATGMQANQELYLGLGEKDHMLTRLTPIIKQALFRAMACDLYIATSNARVWTSHLTDIDNVAQISLNRATSVEFTEHSIKRDTVAVVGGEITPIDPLNGQPRFYVLSRVTIFTQEDLAHMVNVFGVSDVKAMLPSTFSEAQLTRYEGVSNFNEELTDLDDQLKEIEDNYRKVRALNQAEGISPKTIRFNGTPIKRSYVNRDSAIASAVRKVSTEE